MLPDRTDFATRCGLSGIGHGRLTHPAMKYKQYNYKNSSPLRVCNSSGGELTVKQWSKRFIGTIALASPELLEEMLTQFTPQDAQYIRDEFKHICTMLVERRGYILPETQGK